METKRGYTSTTGTFEAVGDDAIAILLNDHQKVKGMLLALPDAPAGQRTALLEEIKAALTVHNATEENLIYPAIREIAGRSMHAGQLYHQQDEAKVLLWELGTLIGSDGDFRPKAEKLRDAILAHVQQEEEHEFPHLRTAAGNRMAKITADVREFRRAFAYRPG